MGSTAMPVRVPVRAIDVVSAAKRGWGEKSLGFQALFAFIEAGPSKAPTLDETAEISAMCVRTFSPEFWNLTRLMWGAFRPALPRQPVQAAGTEAELGACTGGMPAPILYGPGRGGRTPRSPPIRGDPAIAARFVCIGGTPCTVRRETFLVGCQPTRHLGGRTGT